MKLDEPGRQKLDRQKPCKEAQHAKLYSDRLRQRDPFIALGSHQTGGGDFISASAVPHRGVPLGTITNWDNEV